MLVAEPLTGAEMHMTMIEHACGAAPLTRYLKVSKHTGVTTSALSTKTKSMPICPAAIQMAIANQCLWVTSVCLQKLSLLLLYSKIFSIPAFVLTAKVNGVLVLLLGIATILGALLQCQLLACNWDQTIPGSIAVIRCSRIDHR